MSQGVPDSLQRHCSEDTPAAGLTTPRASTKGERRNGPSISVRTRTHPAWAPLIWKEGRQQATGVNHDHRSLTPESDEQLVYAMGGFRIAKPALGERNARSGTRMPTHLRADCLTDQLRFRYPGVAGHSLQGSLYFGGQVQRRLLHAIQPYHASWPKLVAMVQVHPATCWPVPNPEGVVLGVRGPRGRPCKGRRGRM